MTELSFKCPRCGKQNDNVKQFGSDLFDDDIVTYFPCGGCSYWAEVISSYKHRLNQLYLYDKK